ncbi:SDR family oxidoreductase [Microbacterium lushaniae]|uniref:SDR family oxidoreductase n=1 Tax=Microbacterium lushaniae TaxID=2614639 RepID=A0A5J6L2P3_9MICO|nr:SDR family oxidoreductase [Microbacterium lushaniae]QEW02750.1 SDR family oxidoreductase [Microbacterium lushaniae]
MNIEGSVALVTGGNRGIGRHFVQHLLERGATKVYAAARNPQSIDAPGAIPLALDITDPDSVARVAAVATDLTLLVNNAGVSTGTDLVTGDLATIRTEFETNFFGPLAMIRAFAPILARNGGGGILNVNSRLSWLSVAGANAYSASKAASWSMTNGIRLELAGQGTQVTGLYLSATETDMMAGWDIPKNDPADVVTAALDGLEAGAREVLADQDTIDAKAALAA